MLFIPTAFYYLKSRLTAIRRKLPISSGLVLLISVIAGTALAVHLGSRTVSSTKASRSVEPAAAVTVHAAGNARPFFNFRDGRRLAVTYRGNANALQSLQSGQARPRALASIVLSANATPDLITGYSSNGTGIVTVQHGNPEAFAPTDDSIFPRMAQGYNPDALLPAVETYQVPEPVDFIAAGDFNHDNRKDVLTATRGGGLYLLAGDGQGGLGDAEKIDLPGAVTTLATGEFRAADGQPDIAVGVRGVNGPQLLIFDGAEGGVTAKPMEMSLRDDASTVQFGRADTDPFMDVFVAAGSGIEILHGWGRKFSSTVESQREHVTASSVVQGLAVGHFIWERERRQEIALLSSDGAVSILQPNGVNPKRYSDTELFKRNRGNFRPEIKRNPDVEAEPGWKPAGRSGWNVARTVATSAAAADIPGQAHLTTTNMASREIEEVVVAGSRNQLTLVRQIDPEANDKAMPQGAAVSTTGDIAEVNLPATDSPVAVLQLPPKLNGERDLVVLHAGSSAPNIVPLVATAISVDTTADNAALSACTGAANDCSLRGAITFANIAGNSPATITVPAGTYVLSINGTSAGGCDANNVGDLQINLSTTINGAGAATTIIRQSSTGVGGATPGDRIACLNINFLPNLTYNFSGLTMVGGRDYSNSGGAVIGGEDNNNVNFTNCVIANNQGFDVAFGGGGGGGILIQGGNLTLTGSTIGGTTTQATTPGADRTSTTLGNTGARSGGGVSYATGCPSGANGCVGTFTSTNTTYTHNAAASATNGGGGLDLYAINLGTGSAGINGSTFSNNSVTASGGGVILESTLVTTIATSTFSNNSAGSTGGGLSVAGGTVSLNGTALPGVTFSGNTAPTASSLVANAPVTVSGTNFSIDGSVDVGGNGTLTTNAGSTWSLTNLNVYGTMTHNGTGLNISGNLLLGPESAGVHGGIFNVGSGTVNLQGNLSVINSGLANPNNTQFNGNTSTFIFTGSGSQNICSGTPTCNSGALGTSVLTFNNLTDSNTTQPLTSNLSFSVGGTFNINGANAIFDPVAAAVISGAGTLTGTGTARASRTAATADFLNQYTITNKTLTNLQIDYNGAGNQTVNNAPAYTRLRISGTGTKTLQGNTTITSDLTIAAAALDASVSNFSFNLGGNWTNSVGAAGFVPRSGTVTFNGSSGTQTLSGTTTFFNLTLNNAGATTSFGTSSSTVGNDLVTTAGTMDGGTGTIIFTGTGDNAGAISGAAAKSFHNLQINSPATISNLTGGDLTITNDYTNGGTFTQSSGLTTTFATGPDAVHALSGAGTTTFGVVAINTANTVNAGSHNFNVVGATFTVSGTGIFNGNTSTVTVNNGAGAQGIAGDGAKNFGGLTINNGAFAVTVINGTGAVDASVSGILTLTTDLTVGAGAILQQSGTSAGTADVLGTVRRTDLGSPLNTERPFGNLNNTITIVSGTAPNPMDFNLVKAAPGTFPATVKVVPRTYTLTPTGGAGISATVKLRYIDPPELNGPPAITESRLILWKDTTGAGNWVPQGGTVNAASNFVSLTGVSSFSPWAIAEGSDLTLSKANNTANAALTGQSWNWTLTATNTGAPATFTAGQTIILDNLPNSNLNYGTPTIQNASNITGSANISCSITSNDLTCTANGGSVTFASNIGASSFDVVFSATPQTVGSFQNPRTGGGVAQVDPNNSIAESNDTNNTAANNTVTVTKANTTTTISNAASLTATPSVTGQPVTVQWNVTVNAPGSLGTALTGNVTVSDGTNQCVAAVSAGQCDITFTTAGAKNITATYAGDTNYNGSASTPATAHTVNAANTTTTITEDNPDSSTPGQSVTVKWTVTVNSPGSGTPTGNVNVTVSGGAETCSAAVAAGQCSLVLNATGARTITATYVGDANFNTSNDTESHAVCGGSLVTSAADDGSAGTLRQIIANACAGATITFDIPGPGPHTIALTTGELAIAKDLNIKNSSGESITVSSASSRVFNINSGKTAAIIGLTISGNTLTNGGGILNDGNLMVVNSTLTGNNAGTDGAGIHQTAAATSLTLINTTISGNSAAGSGGGVIVLGGTMTSINSTFTNNVADSDNNGTGTGGGIAAQAGTTILKNTIVAGNLNEDGGSDAADDVSGTVDASSSFNLIGTGGSGGLSNGVNNNQVGVASAGLGPLANNGGTTQTHALLATSPAIEAGSNANLPADTFDLDADANTAETLPVDQRGTSFPRIADSADVDTTQTVDIGAFELHPSVGDITDKTTAEDTAVPQITFNLGDGTGSLIATVTATSGNTTLVPNANILVGGSGSTRTLDITPAANRNSAADGTATITVTVTATNGQTAQDTFVLTVDAVNDPPSFVKGADQIVNEDAGAQTVNGWATSISQGPNETGQTLTFNVSVTGTTGSLAFSSAPAIDPTTGNLTYTTSADTNGTANLSVTLSDNGSNTPPNSNTSGAQTFMITVNPINDPPSFTKGPDQNVGDGAGPQTVNNWATNISQGPNETGQTPLTFTVTSTGTIGTLTFSTPPAIDGTTGTLTYTATNGTSGTATFDVTLSDSGSNVPPNSNTSAAQSFSITVNTINDPPVNTVPGAQSMPRNTVFTFTGANQISVADPDAILTDNVIRISLTATNGALTLSGTAGLNFACGGCSGDGTADSSMVFEGTIPNINTALNGMSFTPTLNFTGAASVQIVSDDLGKTGTGGPQTDTDTVNITVTVPVDIYINEVLFNPPGADAPNEYIELRGTPSSTLPAGTYLVAIEGDAADNPGDVQTIINLSGLTFGSNGFLVLLQNGNTYTTAAGATVVTSTTTGFGGLPGGIWSADGGATNLDDSGATFMLIQTGTAPALTNDIDSNNDGTPDGTVYAGWSVRDSVGHVTGGNSNDRGYGAINYITNASGTGSGTVITPGFIVVYVGRICDSTGSTGADWVASGTLDGAAPNWTLNSSTPGFVNPASFAGKLLNHIGSSNFANLAPVNSVPGAQAANEDVPLVFTGGNQISISDPDAGGAVVKVTLTATNGTFSLGGIAGLSFTTGDGTNDPQMVFTGTIANINTALNNLTFTSPSNFFSPPNATLTILTEDQGNTGCGGNQTDSDVINITVNAVNDPPSFTLSGNPPAVNEDAGAQTVNSFATGMSQGPGESGQTLTFNVSPTGTTGNIAFSSGPAIDSTTGNLTYTTSANTNGTATFSVTLSDNGSNVAPNSNTSGAQVFTITVNAVNDAPTFQIPSNPPAVNEDAGAQAVNSFATNFQPGPVTATDEAGQTLVGYTVTANGTTGNLAFTTGPSIDNAGQLTYTPATNTSGTATFNVVATDNGSGTSPNVNQSAPVSFTITVNAQNDAPVLDNSGNMSLVAIDEDVPNASNPGTLVSDIILSAGGDRITDVDAGAVEGIAVTAVDNTNGTWQFSIDNGTNWTPFGSPNATTARLLAANALTRVRFIPSLNFNGTVDPGLTFRAWDQTSGTNGNTADVSINGGTTAFSTATETASITVNPVNDNPTTIGIPPVGVNEDAPDTVIDLRLYYNDVEDGAAGLVYTVTGNTNPGLFTSTSINNANDNLTLDYAPNANGSAQLTIRGTDTGGLFIETTLNVTVAAINDPPSFTKGADQTVNEDAGAQTVAGWATNISQGPGESGQTLTFNVSVGGTTGNLAFSSAPAINATTGALTYTTSANTNGTATINVTLSDNGSNVAPNSNTSAVQSFTITVNAVNDAPTFQIPSSPATVNEDAGAQTVNSFATNFQPGPATATDETGQTLVGYTVTQTGTTGNLAFSSGPAINNAGQLTYTASANTSGTATFNVVATDSGSGTAPNVNQSAPVSFTITVNSVNDVPSFTKGPDITVQDPNPQSFPNWATNISAGPPDESGQTLTFLVTNNNNVLFSAQPAISSNGTLTFTAQAGQDGVATVTVRLMDNGGTANGGVDTSAPQTFTLTVHALNNPPTLNAIGNIVINEDAPLQTVNLSGITPGPSFESNQTLTITATSSNTALIPNPTVSYTNPNTTGSLSFTPVPNGNGVATITVTVKDNGGTANGGVDTFVRTFLVTVNGVNDAPVNSVPGPQNTTVNTLFVFSVGTGNPISISDVDAGSDAVQVTIKATDGTITLNGTAGLSFTVGDGTDDPLMTFTGSLASINAALAGMKNLALGTGVITITTNDLGHNGTGGALTDTDTIVVTVVDSLAPQILTIPGTDRAIAFDSVTFVVDPFALMGSNNFTADHRTHITIFALHAQLKPGETFSAITAEADVAGTTIPLIVESANTVPNFDFLTQITFKFPDGFSTGGGGPHDAKIKITLRGQGSNQAVIIVVPAPRP